MYKREKSIVLKSSSSAVCNNLSVRVSDDDRARIRYAVVHKSTVNLAASSVDGKSVTHQQITHKEHATSMVIQAKLLHLGHRIILVMTSSKGIQIFEADSAILLYWYSLTESRPTTSSARTAEIQTFGRGICSLGSDTICVGTHDGSILLFTVPRKGGNVKFSEELTGHRSSVACLDSGGATMASADDSGDILIWDDGVDQLETTVAIKGSGIICTSLGLWRNVVVSGYGSGLVKVHDVASGAIQAEICAHAAWITALDVTETGTLLTVSEDSFVRVWALSSGRKRLQVEQLFFEQIVDTQLYGGQFVTDEGQAFAVTGYDSNEIMFFRLSR